MLILLYKSLKLVCACCSKKTVYCYLSFTGKVDELSLHRKLGCPDFTLACLLDFPKCPEGDVMSPCFPSPAEVINLVRMFSSLILCGRNSEGVQTFLGSTINLSAILIRNGQYEAAQVQIFVLCSIYYKHILILFDVSLFIQYISDKPSLSTFFYLIEFVGNSGNILEQ